MKTIRAKILSIALIVALLLCSVIIWLTLTAGEKYRSLIAADCGFTVSSEFEYIEDSLGVFEEQAKDLARLGGVYYRMSLRSVEIDKSSIIDNLGFDNNFTGGGVWYEPYAVFPDKERFCYYVYMEDGRIVYDELYESLAYNYPKQEWYIGITEQLKAGKRVAWHEPYIDEAGSHDSMMTVSAGIYDKEGKLVGISTADLGIDFMLELASHLRFTPGTYISSVYEKTGEVLSEAGPAEQRGDTLDFVKLFGNGVKLTVSIPKNELFSEVNGMMRNMFIIVLIIVLASFIVIYNMLDRILNRPISALASKTKEIGRGNLDTVIETKNNDEIGELGAVINKMTSDIKLHIENLNVVTKENERIRSELEIAAKIQHEMLPVLKMNNEGYDIYAEMIPCREVGGDFYDAFLVGGKSLCVVIADVSGKGVPAALFMANAKTTVKTFAETGFSPSEIFTKANKQLSDGNKTRMFVTAFLGILNLTTGEFKYVNAGHNPPLIMRDGRSFEYLETDSGLVLAVSKNATYTESTVQLEYGDKIFLYTDGVTETFNPKNETFGEEKLQNALNEYKDAGLVEMTAEIKKMLGSFADGAPVHDDVTMLSVEVTNIRHDG